LPSKLKYCPLTTFVLNIEVNVANYFLSNLLQQKTRIATDNCELNSLYKFLLAGYKLNLHLWFLVENGCKFNFHLWFVVWNTKHNRTLMFSRCFCFCLQTSSYLQTSHCFRSVHWELRPFRPLKLFIILK
jgi:hypothetical protein